MAAGAIYLLDRASEQRAAAERKMPSQFQANRTIEKAFNRTNNRAMPMLTANDLKTRGVTAIEESLPTTPRQWCRCAGSLGSW